MNHAARLVAPLLASLRPCLGHVRQRRPSHREAPQIALDPAADNTDVYAFVSYDAANLAARAGRSQGDVHPQRQSGTGPEPTAQLLQLRRRRALHDQHRQQPRRHGRRRRLRDSASRRENRPIGGPGGLTSPVPYLGNPHITALGGLLQGITRARRSRFRGSDASPDVHGDRSARRSHRTELFSGSDADRRAVQRRTGDDAELSGAWPRRASTPTRRPAVRVFAGPARRDVLHRSRRGVRHAEPAALPAAAHQRHEDADNVNPFGINRFSGVQHQHDRASRCRSRASRATASLPQRRRIR